MRRKKERSKQGQTCTCMYIVYILYCFFNLKSHSILLHPCSLAWAMCRRLCSIANPVWPKSKPRSTSWRMRSAQLTLTLCPVQSYCILLYIFGFLVFWCRCSVIFAKALEWPISGKREFEKEWSPRIQITNLLCTSQVLLYCYAIYVHACVYIHVLMRDEKEGRSKQGHMYSRYYTLPIGTTIHLRYLHV